LPLEASEKGNGLPQNVKPGAMVRNPSLLFYWTVKVTVLLVAVCDPLLACAIAEYAPVGSFEASL
jgi:hypothetical protein